MATEETLEYVIAWLKGLIPTSHCGESSSEIIHRQRVQDRVKRIETALIEQFQADPQWDGTDGAHPAYWRGSDAAVGAVSGQIERLLGGEKVLGVNGSERLQKVRERVAELVGLAYVPGLHKCPTCSLPLISTALDVRDGSMRSVNVPHVACPNGCGPMNRVTERAAGNDLADRLEKALSPPQHEPIPYTIAELDEDIRQIAGPLAVRGGEWGWSRPHALISAAGKAWVDLRPEDDHSRRIRQAIRDMNEDGSLKPHDGVWPE